MVEWLFKNPIGDGGQFTGISDNLMKYGIVPSGVMVETYSSDNTSRMSNLIGLKLKEYGLELRDAKGSKPEALAKRKTEMLGEIYRMLVLNLGEPPTKFTWTRQKSSCAYNCNRNHCPGGGYHCNAIILSGIRGRRFEEQLCHADERSEPRLL